MKQTRFVYSRDTLVIQTLSLVVFEIFMALRECPFDAQNSAGPSLAGRTQRVVYVDGHGGAPRQMFREDGDQLTAVTVWNFVHHLV